MTGIHTVLRRRGNKIAISDLDYTLHEKNFRIKLVNNKPRCVMAVSYPEGYPFAEWKSGNTTIVLEGMIYNFSKEAAQKKLNKIAKRFARGCNYHQLVRAFVESADGEYVVQIWQASGKFLIFNDFLGRLPVYYYCNKEICVFSKEIKSILNFIPKIDLNRYGIVEFLRYEYPLGNKTIFKDVFRFNPSQIINVTLGKKGMRWEVTNSADLNFSLKNSFLSKKESLSFLKDAFLEAIENRVKTLKRENYKLIADLSGGYDSRTVLAGLKKFSVPVSYFTFEYVADESSAAAALFFKMGAPGEYHKLKFKNEINFQNLSDLIYKTDGLVNYCTTSICYNDIQNLKINVPEKAARFTGLGGEFIRHPFKFCHRSIFHSLAKGFRSALPLNVACDLAQINVEDYEKELRIYLNTYPEKSLEDQLKRLYYEYYNHHVCASAEDRERIHFWTAPPLFGLKFIRAIFERIPLNWVGYKYFIQFMKTLDPALLESKIHGSTIRLNSSFSVNFNEVVNTVCLFTWWWVRIKMPPLFNVLKRLSDIKKRLKWKYKDANLSLIEQSCLRFNQAKKIINFNVRAPLDDFSRLRVLTLLMYLKEVDARFKDKFL